MHPSGTIHAELNHLFYQGTEAIFNIVNDYLQNLKLSYPLSTRQMEYVYGGHPDSPGASQRTNMRIPA